MGSNLPTQCGNCCSSEQTVDRDSLNETLTSQRALKTTLYNSSDSSADGEGEDSSYSSDSEQAYSAADPAEVALKAQVIESFKAALQNGNTSLVEYYFNEHPDEELARTKWRNGDTCLHVAVRKRDQNLIRMLLKEGVYHGVNINEQNAMTGDTCLHTAVRDMQDTEMVQLLIDHEIDPNIMNNAFHTPLRIAVERRIYDIMDILTKYALDLDAANRRYSTSSESLHEHAVLRHARSILVAGTPFAGSPPSLSPKSSGYLSEEEYAQLTMEEKMDDDTKSTLAKVNLKSKNPFSKVKVTKQEGHDVKMQLRELEQLPDLNGFLMKQTSKPPYSYHKRWIFVTEEWFFWNDRMIDVNFESDRGPTYEERKRFSGAVHFKNIVEVKRTGKSGKKFVFKVRYKQADKLRYKKVLWKCLDETERDFWFNSLMQYVKYYKEVRRLYVQ